MIERMKPFTDGGVQLGQRQKPAVSDCGENESRYISHCAFDGRFVAGFADARGNHGGSIVFRHLLV
jgi:hypothetical protein